MSNNVKFVVCGKRRTVNRSEIDNINAVLVRDG